MPFVVEVKSYDYFSYYRCKRFEFENKEDAIAEYDKHEKYDYEYEDAYQRTEMFEE